MRSRLVLLTLTIYLAFAALACTKKADSPDNAAGTAATDTAANPSSADAKGSAAGGSMAAPSSERKARQEAKEVKKEPIVVPTGTAITINLGSSLGSKLSQAGQSFSGTVAKDVTVGEAVAIRKGASVTGTVADAKPLGKFKGGAELQISLTSISVKGTDVQVQTAPKLFSAKGKGKRTAILAGGGAALGGIVGALAGGGKGAAIGLAAGGGAGAGGAAFTGNKDIVLPAESAVSFELSQPLEIKR
jgi:hypothetical protein